MTGSRATRQHARRLAATAAAAALALSLGLPASGAGPDAGEFFERQVRPILVERCAECHGATGKAKGGLRLVSRESVLKGGDSGPGAVAGKPDESLIVEAVRYAEEPKMPPAGKLDAREIETLTRWVALGMPWPASAAAKPVPAAASPAFQVTDEQRRYWAFRPLGPVTPPAVKDADWPRGDVDRFVLAALEAKGLRPAPPADRRAYIRRVSYDLTGLPPTPEEAEAFAADESPRAFERLVDRLLASPRYGERWGRHWLDLVRYTDSADARIAGSNNEMDFNESWRYRDWVVDAFNRDMPYDRFVQNQIAGDLLPAGRDPVNVEGTVATGMLAIGNWGGGDADKEKLLTDIADDQVDVVSRAFMGLTVACARCHDHKFDPISTKDYYGLAGIFFSTHILANVGPKTNGPPILRIPLESRADTEARARHAERIKTLDAEIARVAERARAETARSLRGQTAAYVLAAWDGASGSGGNAPADLTRVAKERGLRPDALRRWASALGLAAEERLLSSPVGDVLGRAGVFAWRGKTDPPVALINTNREDAALLTFKVPARSVTLHPGTTGGVAVAWVSPVAGEVRVSGRVADTDPNGGDGVSWSLDLIARGRPRNLARGDLANGGTRDALTTRDGKPPGPVRVEPGDAIRLTIGPRAEYTCDTTHVGLTVRGDGGEAAWDLADDLTADPLAGNPHADRRGRPGVWHLLEVGDPSRPKVDSLDLGELGRVLADPKADRAAVESAAEAFQARFDRTDATSPFWPRTPAEEADFAQATRDEIAGLRRELEALRKNPPPPPRFANGAQEGGVPGSPHAGVHDVRVHVRGSYARLGDLVPRHFPVVLAGETPPKIAPGASGRLELARWLTAPDHPLTPRVMANRIWQHHFGAGIVRTPGNFGKLGERPTHPELLDYLARRFVERGWSVKALHREVVLSAAYRQSTEGDPATFRADPDNRLFGRMNRRRLDAESVRDSLLAAAGRLDPKQGGPASRDPNVPRRSLYLMTIRSDRSSFGPLFDAADPTAMVDTRNVSTVAPQALYLLNNAFVLDQARAFAERLRAVPGDGPRIDRAYALLYGRPPTDDERRVGRESLSALARAGGGGEDAAWAAYAHVLLCTNEWIYLD